MATALEHEFGAQHTEIKLDVVKAYLERFAIALRPKFDRLWYIDAFAGTGFRTERSEARSQSLFDPAEPERLERRRGSATVAIEVSPPFDRLVFMEADRRHCEALEELRSRHPQRDIQIVRGDANDLIQRDISWPGWRSTRAVMFLDPYGMTVEWPTLEAIATTGAIDVWYLFPTSALSRQLAHRHSSVDAHKRDAITRLLGTGAWLDELYSAPVADDLLSGVDPGGTLDRQRAADIAQIEAFAKKRLETVFAYVSPPLPLPVVDRPQLFSLFCAISNKNDKAIGLASKFSSDVIAKARRSARSSRLTR